MLMKHIMKNVRDICNIEVIYLVCSERVIDGCREENPLGLSLLQWRRSKSHRPSLSTPRAIITQLC